MMMDSLLNVTHPASSSIEKPFVDCRCATDFSKVSLCLRAAAGVDGAEVGGGMEFPANVTHPASSSIEKPFVDCRCATDFSKVPLRLRAAAGGGWGRAL